MDRECQPATLKALKAVKERYGVKTTLGVSNVSFGLPNRQLLSETFLNLALFHGLDLPIIDPNASGMMNTIRAFAVLSGRDESCERYVAHFSGMAAPAATPVAAEGEVSLQDIILSGYKEKAGPATAALLKTKEPLDIVDHQLIPALDIVGEGYEKGKLFLPQLISAAQTVQASFEVLKAHLAKNSAGSVSKGTIIVATVKGDIHDIGKNIVKAVSYTHLTCKKAAGRRPTAFHPLRQGELCPLYLCRSGDGLCRPFFRDR